MLSRHLYNSSAKMLGLWEFLTKLLICVSNEITTIACSFGKWSYYNEQIQHCSSSSQIFEYCCWNLTLCLLLFRTVPLFMKGYYIPVKHCNIRFSKSLITTWQAKKSSLPWMVSQPRLSRNGWKVIVFKCALLQSFVCSGSFTNKGYCWTHPTKQITHLGVPLTAALVQWSIYILP